MQCVNQQPYTVNLLKRITSGLCEGLLNLTSAVPVLATCELLVGLGGYLGDGRGGVEGLGI